jgi:hypothetical protein
MSGGTVLKEVQAHKATAAGSAIIGLVSQVSPPGCCRVLASTNEIAIFAGRK